MKTSKVCRKADAVVGAALLAAVAHFVDSPGGLRRLVGMLAGDKAGAEIVAGFATLVAQHGPEVVKKVLDAAAAEKAK